MESFNKTKEENKENEEDDDEEENEEMKEEENENEEEYDIKFRRVLKYCPEPCGGKKPCIRTCLCGRGFMSNGHGSCEPMSEAVKQNLTKALTLKDGESSTRMLILTGGLHRYDISQLIIDNYSDWHDKSEDQGEDSWLDVLYSEKLSRRDLSKYILTSRK